MRYLILLVMLLAGSSLANAASLSRVNGFDAGAQQQNTPVIIPNKSQEQKKNKNIAENVTFLDLYMSYLKAKAGAIKTNKTNISEKQILKYLVINEKYLLMNMIDEYEMGGASESLNELRGVIREFNEPTNAFFVNDSSFLVRSQYLNGQLTNISNYEIINGSFNNINTRELLGLSNNVYRYKKTYRNYNKGMSSNRPNKVKSKVKKASSISYIGGDEDYKEQWGKIFIVFNFIVNFILSGKILIVIFVLFVFSWVKGKLINKARSGNLRINNFR